MQADSDKVIRRPRAGVPEGELAFVALRDFLHAPIEELRPITLHQKRHVHNHFVADRLVRTRRDRTFTQVLVDIANVRVGTVGQRLLNHAAELHACKVRRLLAFSDLFSEATNALIVALDVRQDLFARPVDAQTKLQLVLHLDQHVAQIDVRVFEELDDIFFGLEQRAEAHRDGRVAAFDDDFVDVLVGQDILARRVVDDQPRAADDRREVFVVDCVDVVSASANADLPKAHGMAHSMTEYT